MHLVRDPFWKFLNFCLPSIQQCIESMQCIVGNVVLYAFTLSPP
uniref:Uncharacterized protein n=1 Tax=Anguilla anguilla TaxID=7936 RepID=A0A0E9WDE2_ANGAN